VEALAEAGQLVGIIEVFEINEISDDSDKLEKPACSFVQKKCGTEAPHVFEKSQLITLEL
jgi:hypothetical protein